MVIKSYQGKTPLLKGAYLAEDVSVIGDVEVKENASIWYGVVLRGDVDKIVIGENTSIQDNSVVHCATGLPTVVGKNCVVGHNAILHSCTVEEECLIGMGAVIMNDAVIGEHSIVGAGALITEGKVFPANSLILGAPAKAKGEVDEKGKRMIRDAADHYVHLGREYVNIDVDK